MEDETVILCIIKHLKETTAIKIKTGLCNVNNTK